MKYYARWIFISTLTGLLCGGASALFLYLLDIVTEARIEHPWLLHFLPVGGLLVGLLYFRFGRGLEDGSNLLIEEFHDPQKKVRLRLAPVVLLGTLITHLFGGSAGREGVAVQMGGALAFQVGKFFKFATKDRKTLLMVGMSGGFASVFGVPFAGMIFGLEVLHNKKLQLSFFFECAIAAFVAHLTALALGAQHTVYPTVSVPDLTVLNFMITLACGLAFGLTARCFSFLSLWMKKILFEKIPVLPMRAMIGGTIISILFILFPPVTRYAGLGVPIILDSFTAVQPLADWLGKLLMTVFTLASGFKGGEVTPLLFVGSTLGNALSTFLPMSMPLLASLGFVAVFAGAANTPVACAVMAMELFGPQVFIFAVLACFASYMVSGSKGIYHAQQ